MAAYFVYAAAGDGLHEASISFCTPGATVVFVRFLISYSIINYEIGNPKFEIGFSCGERRNLKIEIRAANRFSNFHFPLSSPFSIFFPTFHFPISFLHLFIFHF